MSSPAGDAWLHSASREAYGDAGVEEYAYMEGFAAAQLKDHEFRELVNELRYVAETYGQTAQCRERIATVLKAGLKR